MIQLKRIYDPLSSTDGYRVLVDRLWPRGVSREKASNDIWLKDIAPSPKLRTWFGHDPVKFKQFSHLYREELKSNPAVGQLADLIKQHRVVTLLYGARDPVNNHAVVLKSYLESLKK